MTTESIVVGTRPSGEAASILTLFTRELGLLSVMARGIRYERSKLRYHVQLYSFVEVTLVQGHEHWVLIGAVSIERLSGRPNSERARAHVATLLVRFLGEADPHTELYDNLLHIIHDGDGEGVETRLSLATFERLGYLGRAQKSEHDALFLIEQAVRESHL